MRKGTFNNYVDQILPNSPRVDKHVVIECPKFQLEIGTTYEVTLTFDFAVCCTTTYLKKHGMRVPREMAKYLNELVNFITGDSF